MYNYTKRYNSFSTGAMAAKAIVNLLHMPLRLADESDDDLVNALFRNGKWKDHKDAKRVTMCLCNVSTGRVLELIAMAIGLRRSGEGAAQNVGI